MIAVTIVDYLLRRPITHCTPSVNFPSPRMCLRICHVLSLSLGGKPQGVGEKGWVEDIGMRVGRRGEAEGVGSQVAAGGRVVVALAVVMQAGLVVCVLAGETQRSGGAGPVSCAPQGVLLVA